MTFPEYWLRLLDRNAGLRNGGDTKMTLTVDAFRKALEKAHGVGVKHGEDGVPLFDRIFGKMGL